MDLPGRVELGGEWARATPETITLMINFLPAHPKEHDEQEYLEEGAEDVGVAAEEENEGDEGGDAAIEDSRAHVHLKENIKIDWESN